MRRSPHSARIDDLRGTLADRDYFCAFRYWDGAKCWEDKWNKYEYDCERKGGHWSDKYHKCKYD